MKWNHGGTFGFDKPCDDLACLEGDPSGKIWAAARHGTELRTYIRGSQNPYPWEEIEQIPGEYVGSGSIGLWRDGRIQIRWPRLSDGKIDNWYVHPDDVPDPSVGPVPILKEEYQYKNFNKIISPFFAPDLLTNHLEISDEDFQKFLNKFAEQNVGNVIRCFLCAIFEAEHDHKLHFPHPRDGHGKFLIYAINLQWWDLVIHRLGEMKKRGITAQIDVVNGGGYNRWPRHWMNPENNHENTHPSRRYAPWHYYQYLDDPDEGEQYRNTKRYLDWFEDYSIRKIETLFPGWAIWGFHEVKAAIDYHRDVYWPKFEPYGITKDHLVTNIDVGAGADPLAFADFPQMLKDSNVLDLFYNLSTHGAYSRDEYYDWLRKERDGYKIIPDDTPVILSGDGQAFSGDEGTVIDLVDIMNQDGHKGIELNQWAWDPHTFKDVIELEKFWKIGRTLRDAAFS